VKIPRQAEKENELQWEISLPKKEKLCVAAMTTKTTTERPQRELVGM
jgi:hypothetical protein